MTFAVTILGSNAALPTSKRFSTAQVLNAHERFFLIDCAESTQVLLRKNKISLGKINHIFISHLHGDHYFGIFGLLNTLSLLGRKNDLHIYTHPPLQTMIDAVIQTEKLSFKLIFHFLNNQQPEKLFENAKIEILSFPLKHRIPTCGFYFREKPFLRNIKKQAIEKYQIPLRNILEIKQGKDFISATGKKIPNAQITLPPYHSRSYAYCSDTAPHPPATEVFKGVDLLYHEATFADSHKQQAQETFHSTARQAAQIAQIAQAGKLLIGHFSSRNKRIEELENQAREIFPNTFAVNDGQTYPVPRSREKQKF